MIVASDDPSWIGRRLTDALGDDQPLTTLADRAGAMRIALRDADVIAAARTIDANGGELATASPLLELSTLPRRSALREGLLGGDHLPPRRRGRRRGFAQSPQGAPAV